MRALSLLFGLALLTTVACSGNTTNNPAAPAASTASFSGTWVGSANDSSGSMMGSGLGNASTIAWTLTQADTQVTGSMSYVGMTPGQASPTIGGTVSGSTMNFTISMPATSMPAPYTLCTATASGTLNLNAAGTSMTGTYSGTSSCVGGFAGGQLSLIRQ